ncbi:MAG: 30S ribosomal protein S18 [Candidatus Cloacimonetes bacterium]|nr:30S ribosomal protein S18 [Candidatus Cloacimonadota bacterium]MCF7813253.1 30S ribosomal protein S18 [Candidatus Cloacimonadota bacterium]MCF7867452.1 30S ribosomal protein S18 [Candidatus Cloacimonadota bacterium]MCF7882916.1 30S ribosomal protein S18 [Candidatus Cloacimonadota bacterium]
MEEKKETKKNVNDQADKKVEEKKERKEYKRSESSRRPQKKRFSRKKFFFKKRVCFFCTNKDSVIDYKDVGLMKRFVSDNGKISPRRFTGTCAKHQKKVSVEIKKARQMALLPFTDKHK